MAKKYKFLDKNIERIMELVPGDLIVWLDQSNDVTAVSLTVRVPKQNQTKDRVYTFNEGNGPATYSENDLKTLLDLNRAEIRSCRNTK